MGLCDPGNRVVFHGDIENTRDRTDEMPIRRCDRDLVYGIAAPQDVRDTAITLVGADFIDLIRPRYCVRRR